jgi:hypothetical protein
LPSPLRATTILFRIITSQLLLFAKPQSISMQTQYSGLEVAPSDGLLPKQLNHSGLEVRHESMNEKAMVHGSYVSETIPLRHEAKLPNQHKICGLRRVTFWLTLALVATIIVAIVGGSVGTTLLLRKSQANEDEGISSVE